MCVSKSQIRLRSIHVESDHLLKRFQNYVRVQGSVATRHYEHEAGGGVPVQLGGLKCMYISHGFDILHGHDKNSYSRYYVTRSQS